MAMAHLSHKFMPSRQASRATAPVSRVFAPRVFAPAAQPSRAVAAQAKGNSDEQPTSVWLSTAGVKAAPLPKPTYPQVPSGSQNHYDVVVIGAGILGITTAYLAKKAGKKVALIEARTIGSGTTSFSTSKLSAQQGPVYSSISSQLGKQSARTYYDMNMMGIMLVEKMVKEFKLDCEFSPRSHMMWCSDPNMMSTIQSEYEACLNIDIPDVRLVQADELTKELPKTLYPKLAVCFDNQAQFNSYKYCNELVKHVKGDGSDVFEHSRVTSVSDAGPLQGGRPHDIELAELGAKLSADNVVLATGLPIMDRSLHFSILEPSRSPCIAFRVKKDSKSMRNMFVNADMPMRSMRVTGKNDDIVVLSGEGYLVGEVTDTDAKYAALEGWARQHFEVEEMVSRWSAMDYYSSDHVPFVGYLDAATKSIFTGTGFSKWGLALGVASAALINDLIDGKENAFHSLVDARRWDVNARLKGLAQEGMQTAKHLVTDKVKHNFLENTKIEMLQPGEGAVCKAGSKTVGAYRDVNGKFHVVEPVCTHLGCDVRFNQGDKCWDCPCHGSQFGIDGTVLHGPAVTPLPKVTDINVQV